MLKPFKEIYVHHALAKNKESANGYFVVQNNNEIHFISGRCRVHIREHFADTIETATQLFENTIRFEGKKYTTACN